MNWMKWLKRWGIRFSTIELFVLLSATAGLCFSGVLIFLFPYLSSSTFGLSPQQMKTVGKINTQVSDTRIKSRRAFHWNSAGANQAIRTGDSLFTGEKSHAQVELDSGATLEVGENSLVTFAEVNGIQVPRLDLGDFKLKSNGRQQVLIRGELTQIDSSNSNLQIKIEEKKAPEIVLLAGTAQVESSSIGVQALTAEAPPLQLPMELPAEIIPVPTLASAAVPEVIVYEYHEPPPIVVPPLPVVLQPAAQPMPDPVIEPLPIAVPQPQALQIVNQPTAPPKKKLEVPPKGISPPQVSQKEIERTPAAVEVHDPSTQLPQSSLPLEAVKEFMNQNFRKSVFQVEGVFFSMFSKNQIEAKTAEPAGALVNIGWLHWFENFGFEGKLKTKLASTNESGKDTSPSQLEGRLHRRYLGSFPWGLTRSMQSSLFGGIEIYRNSNSSKLYSPRYDLLKLGFSLHFPLAHYWAMGGDLAYGQGLEGSRKYEISGFAHYYFNETWSFGAGYRMNLFESKSTTTTPAGLPFREAYGEAYSVIRWSY